MNQRIATILLGLALATGCKNGGVQANTADLWVLPPDGSNATLKMSADFGSGCIGVGKDLTFKFTASATAVITVNPTDIGVTGPFSFVNKPTAPFNVSDVGSDTTLTLHFDPTMQGPATGTLKFAAAQGANNMPLSIALTGNGANGAPEPHFDSSCPLPGASSGTLPLTPCTNLTFQNVYFSTTQNIAVNLFNDGGCPPFVVDDVHLEYPGGAFSDGGGPFNAVGLTLPVSVALADPAYSLVMSYAPKCPTVGCTSTTDSATLKIHTTNGIDGDAGTWQIDLNGSGVAPIVTLAGPNNETGCNKFARFGDTNGYAYEREPITLTFSITNGAQATPVVVGPAYLDAGNTGFTIVHNSCWATTSSSSVLPDGGISLPTKNSSANCDVTFDAVNAANPYPKNGAFFDYLQTPYTALEADGGADFTASVCLRAVAEPRVCVLPSNAIDLPPVTYCGFVPQAIEFSNCGSVDLLVNDIFLGPANIDSWTLFKGSSFPTTLQWADAPITTTVVYSDDGGINNPSTSVIMSSNATAGTIDGGTTVLIQAFAEGLNPPPDFLVPVFTNGGGKQTLNGSTYQVDMPITGVTPYAMNWYYMFDGGIVDAGELVTDGGYHAWLTPNVGAYGTFSVCANVVELPLPDGGNCNASVDGGGNCTNPKLTTI